MTERPSHREIGRQTGEVQGESVRRPLIGAQISTAGGFAPVPERTIAIGAEAVQIFSSNPRMWPTRSPDPEELTALAASLANLRLPLFFHSVYLINLASPDEQLRERSSLALSHALATGALADATGVVTHVGSHKGEGFGIALGRVVESINAARAAAGVSLAESGSESSLPHLLLETGAGAGTIVGSRLEELAALTKALEIGLCLDTAHMFAAGYPLHEAEGLESVMDELTRLGLLNKTGLIHLNDSTSPFASNRDRHENPGEGLIGYDGLARVVRHPALAQIPFALEVPGAKGHGPEAAEVALVKSMRAGAPGPPKRPAPGA
jgi:deoxyribonuclease IV